MPTSQSSQSLAYALSYADLGYRVLPVALIPEDNGKFRKAPTIRDWPNQATTDEEAINAWWGNRPDLGVGILTDKLVVVDVDPGADVAAVEELLGINMYNRYMIPQATTPRGGRHYYFRRPDDATWASKTGVLPSVDIKTGDRSFITAPPTCSGDRGYAWEVPLVSPEQLLPPPPELLRLLENECSRRPEGPETESRETWREAAQETGNARFSIGTRNTQLFALGCRFYRLGLRRNLAAALLAFNEELCQEPLTTREVEDIADNVRRYYNGIETSLESLARDSHGDIYHARAFAILHDHPEGYPFRYVPELRQWYQWEGNRWLALNSEEAITYYVGDTLAMAYLEKVRHIEGELKELTELKRQRESANGTLSPDEEERFKQVSALYTFFVKKYESISSLTTMRRVVDLIKGTNGIMSRADDWNLPPGLLPLRNGILDLRDPDNIRLLPHSRRNLFLSRADVDYDPQAECPKWLEHMELCLPDPEIQREVQRELGAALFGQNYQFVPIWYGEGGNGKSVTLETIRAVFGDFYLSDNKRVLDCLESVSSGHTEPVIALRGKRLVALKEITASGKLIANSIKHLTGGERIMARAPYARKSIEIIPSWLILISTNHKPRLSESDYGVWRRLRVIPWTEKITEKLGKTKQFDEVVAELSSEKSGILNWLIAGYIDYCRDPDWMPGIVRKETDEYQETQDRLLPFFEQCCDFQDPGPDPTKESTDYWVNTTDLLNAFIQWCQATRLKLANPRHELAEWLQGSGPKKYFGVQVIKKVSGTKRTIHYFGIKLRPNWGSTLLYRQGVADLDLNGVVGLGDDEF